MSARVLVIEDNPANLELMTYLLRAYKYETLSAVDGEEGLAAAQRERPQVVICDIQLPRMDGFEVVRRLKADEATRGIPVVAVTAFAMVGDRDRVLGAGFDGYIGKPIVPETFVSHVEQFLRSAPHDQPVRHDLAGQAAQPASAEHAGARILVVDNTPANRQLLASILKPVGYDVVTAQNVSAALASARTVLPDLVFSDVHMPGQGGVEFLKELRADPQLRDIPFVFTSATTLDERQRREAMATGGDLFLLLPVEPAVLLAEVHRILARKARPGGAGSA